MAANRNSRGIDAPAPLTWHQNEPSVAVAAIRGAMVLASAREYMASDAKGILFMGGKLCSIYSRGGACVMPWRDAPKIVRGSRNLMKVKERRRANV